LHTRHTLPKILFFKYLLSLPASVYPTFSISGLFKAGQQTTLHRLHIITRNRWLRMDHGTGSGLFTLKHHQHVYINIKLILRITKLSVILWSYEAPSTHKKKGRRNKIRTNPRPKAHVAAKDESDAGCGWKKGFICPDDLRLLSQIRNKSVNFPSRGLVNLKFIRKTI